MQFMYEFSGTHAKDNVGDSSDEKKYTKPHDFEPMRYINDPYTIAERLNIADRAPGIISVSVLSDGDLL